MQICRSVVILVLSRVFVVSGRPTTTRRDAGPYLDDWSDAAAREDVSWASGWLSQCSSFDLSRAELPTAAPTPLPRPTGTLSHVAIGRGTQNYTCDLSDPEATPVAVGALATLYNVSCIAATNPDLLSYLPNIAYSIRLRTLPNFFSEGASSPSSSSIVSRALAGIAKFTPVNLVLDTADAFMSGHHFFVNDTTPRFDLDTSNGQLGCVTATKVAQSDAPADSAESSVAWLYLRKLESYSSAPQSYSEVYRVNTVGGSPPSTCSELGRPHFRRQYSAQYWFYK